MLANFYEKNIIEKPKLVFSILVLILIAFFNFSKDFRLDASSETLLLENDPDLKYLNEINERYGAKEFLVLTYSPKIKMNSEASIKTLSELKKIELHCGRIRDPNNKFTPRTLDLDIIDWNSEEAIIEGYQMPDPDIKKHDFIKIPYSEIKD